MAKAKKPRNSTQTGVAAAKPHPITYLPFVRDLAVDGSKKITRCFWHISTTGDYQFDYELGAALARRAIAYMRSDEGSSLLGWIVKDMTKRGQFGGVEIGFMAAIASAASRG